MKKKQMEQVRRELSRRSFLLRARKVGAGVALLGLGTAVASGVGGCVYDDYDNYADYIDYSDYSNGYGANGVDDVDDYTDGYADAG